MLSFLANRNAIPVFNANDPVNSFEMKQWMERSADNDVLAGEVARQMKARNVILLTETNGVYIDGTTVQWEDPDNPYEYDFGEKSPMGTGGMESKHNVAIQLAREGRSVVIANGHTPNILLQIMNGEPVGTLYERIE